jgi:hypothetical protein
MALRQAIGPDLVFMDTSSVEPGSKWPDAIKNSLTKADAVLVIVGPQWIRSADEWGRRRIDQEDDWVRREVSLALKENKTVIPILVRGAKLPPEDVLPQGIKELPQRQVIELRRDYWEHDVKLLLAQFSETEIEKPDSKKNRASYRRSSPIRLDSIPKDSLTDAFAQFQKEVREAISALGSSQWVGQLSIEGHLTPLTYLERVAQISQILLDDSLLLYSQEQSLIAIHFYELYSYLTSEARIASSLPVVDYCVEESPFSLVLLPACAVELITFTKYHTSRFANLGSRKRDNHLIERLLEDFVLAYEQDPNSSSALDAYQRLKRELAVEPFSVSMNLKKLVDIIRSGRIKTYSKAQDYTRIIHEDKNVLHDIMTIFDRVRPIHRHDPLQRFKGAINMSFLKLHWSSPADKIRMISSSPSFRRVGDLVFGANSPLRTSSEFAYLVNAFHYGNRRGDSNLLNFINELLESTHKLADYIEDKSHLVQMKRIGGEDLKEFSDAFLAFTPWYRDLLRPVDRMIVSGVRSFQGLQNTGMQELYTFLISEARLVEGFRRWWESVCDLLRSLNEAAFPDDLGRNITEAFSGLR